MRLIEQHTTTFYDPREMLVAEVSTEIMRSSVCPEQYYGRVSMYDESPIPLHVELIENSTIDALRVHHQAATEKFRKDMGI